jgi:predicted dehydrogenase
LEIYGTLGGIQVEDDVVMRWWSPKAPAETNPASVQPSSAGAGADPRGISVAGHIALVNDFIRALREGRPPLVDGVEGRRSLATVTSIYQAAGRISGSL